MVDLPTLGLLAIADGRLMGPIDDVYEVVGHLIGRPAYTHELPMYGRKARPLIVETFPGMGADMEMPWQVVRDAALARHGERVAIPATWEGSLADGENCLSTLAKAVAEAKRQ